MLNNIYNIGVTSLTNAQVGVSNASNNIANADTEGYARTQVVTTTSSTITINGLAAGTGADIVAIQAQIDSFIEAQYLDASSEYEAYAAIYEQLSQAESILSTDEDSGLSTSLDAFWSAWNDLAENPSSESAREALLGVSETLVYELRSTSEELDELQRGIEDEIATQVGEANSLLEQIAELNLAVAADSTDLDALYARNLAVENLAGLMDITVSDSNNGMVAIYTAGGTQLLQDGEYNELTYLSSYSTQSQTDASTWDGEMSFSGESSEEILMEFVSGGADGAAQFKVSYDGGSTWETDEDGNVLLYTASATEPAVVDGVEIVFSGTGDHAAGDRYGVTAKSGLYLTTNGGDSYKTLTPLTDSSGENESGRISGGSLAGLFMARDDTLASLQDEVDELAEALIWEVNKLHSQGAGLEHQNALSGTCAAGDSSAVLSGSGLEYAERITSGELSLASYDADGNVLSLQSVTIDPDADTLDGVVASLNTAFGGELTFTVETDGTVSIQTGTADSFEITSDETGLLAALGPEHLLHRFGRRGHRAQLRRGDGRLPRELPGGGNRRHGFFGQQRHGHGHFRAGFRRGRGGRKHVHPGRPSLRAHLRGGLRSGLGGVEADLCRGFLHLLPGAEAVRFEREHGRGADQPDQISAAVRGRRPDHRGREQHVRNYTGYGLIPEEPPCASAPRRYTTCPSGA